MTELNSMTDLRNQLFETMRGIKDGTIKPEVAKIINSTAQTIINSVQAETNMLEVVGGKGSGFISSVHHVAIPSPYKPALPSSGN
jgi:hypothetical protein